MLATSRSGALPEGSAAQFATRDEVLAEADHLVLAAPLTPQTRGIMNREAFGKIRNQYERAIWLYIHDFRLFKHALDATRAVMADGAGIGDVAADLYWIAGYTAAAVGLAVAGFGSKMIE